MLLSESLPQHKRKASALDLNAFEPSSCKERRSSDQEGQEGLADAAEQPAEPQEDAPALVLTDRSSMHLMQLRESQDELMKQIDDITAMGLAVLDGMRSSLLQRMQTVKQEVTALVDNAQESLCADSTHTLHLQRRAAVAGDLIGKLNVKSRDEQQVRPSTLFSADEQEEGQEGQEGQDGQEGQE